MTEETPFDPITLEILWSQLIAIADEAAATLVRTAFSTIVRESNDYVCTLLDRHGNSLAENTYGCPAFIGTLPRTMRHILAKYPADQWRPGDAILTNDPWLGTGHLPDMNMVMPIYYRGELVAFAGSTCHSPDVGGKTFGADAREVFEEGIRVPISKFMREGEPNTDLISFIEANVRVPEQTVGDLFAQVAALEVCARRLREFLAEQHLPNLDALADATQTRAEEAMRAAIRGVPDGIYRATVEGDAVDGRPITIRAAMTVADDELIVDYAGTSPQVLRGVNSVMNYTYSHTCYPIKCALDPQTRKNEGSYRPVTVKAPLGSVVNPRYPAPVNARHLIGHFLSSAVFNCLVQAVPDKVIADSSGPPMITFWSGTNAAGKPFSQGIWTYGGMGARSDSDGLNATSYPGNFRCAPVEMLERLAPILIETKRVLPDSAGAGTYRGGAGQELRIRLIGDNPVQVSVMSMRTEHAPQGVAGGLAGTPDTVTVEGRGPIDPRGRTLLYPGEVIHLNWAGGGGYGPPSGRPIEAILDDTKSGVLTHDAAQTLYGLALKGVPA